MLQVLMQMYKIAPYQPYHTGYGNVRAWIEMEEYEQNMLGKDIEKEHR